jgi:hypothetical protein
VTRSVSSLKFGLATLDQLDALVPLRVEFLRLLTTHTQSQQDIKDWIINTIGKGKLYILLRDNEIVSVAASGRETEKSEAVIMVR